MIFTSKGRRQSHVIFNGISWSICPCLFTGKRDTRFSMQTWLLVSPDPRWTIWSRRIWMRKERNPVICDKLYTNVLPQLWHWCTAHRVEYYRTRLERDQKCMWFRLSPLLTVIYKSGSWAHGLYEIPPNILKRKSCTSVLFYFYLFLLFVAVEGLHILGSNVAEVLLKFQSKPITLNPYLAVSRTSEIWQKEVLWLSNYKPVIPSTSKD